MWDGVLIRDLEVQTYGTEEIRFTPKRLKEGVCEAFREFFHDSGDDRDLSKRLSASTSQTVGLLPSPEVGRNPFLSSDLLHPLRCCKMSICRTRPTSRSLPVLGHGSCIGIDR